MNSDYKHAIELKAVSVSYEPGVPVLKNINVVIDKGEFVGVIGAPGSGKSTFINLMAGIIPHYQSATIEGQVLMGGVETSTLNLARIATQVGIVSQDPENQLFNLLVKDEVVWGLENRGVEREEMEVRLVETLDFFHIGPLRERITYGLSGGEKQRVALASTYIFRPDILILDNPTSQLDPAGTSMIIESIKEIREQHQTVIMVEEKIDELLEYTDRLLVLHQGEIVLDVPTDELSRHISLLHEIGLRPPEVVELNHRLEQQGIRLERHPIGLRDAVQLLGARLNPDWRAIGVNEGGRNRARVSHTPTAGSPAQIEVTDLSFTYPPPRTVQALKDVNLAIEKGSFVAIIGRNGSGKTTLARCISGYLKPGAGRVTISGKEVHRMKLAERVDRVGYVFQNPDHQIFKDSVRSDVEFGPRNLGWPPEKIAERTNHVLSMLNLEQYEQMHPYMLSIGNRQRLAIASIAAMTPDVLIIDEPTTGQDHVHARQVMNLLASLRDEGITIIVVTHAMNLVGEYCDRVVAMNEGQVLIDGPPAEVFSNPELLELTSVVPPPVAQLALQLGVTPPPLTIDEATSVFARILAP